MKGFVFRLIAPRPDFPFTMDDAERAAMHQHVEYWTALLAQGHTLAFGPVADPGGPYGISIVMADDQAQAQEFADGDPVRAIPGFRTEIAPMLSVVTPAGRFDA